MQSKADKNAYARAYGKTPQGKRTVYAAQIKHVYGLELEDLARAFEKQGGRCANQGCTQKLLWGRETHIDHCARTGYFRGLLCHDCNVALGQVQESATRLHGLGDYIAKFNEAYYLRNSATLIRGRSVRSRRALGIKASKLLTVPK